MEVGLDGRRGEEEMEGVEGGKIIIRIYYMKTKANNPFSIKGERRKYAKNDASHVTPCLPPDPPMPHSFSD